MPESLVDRLHQTRRRLRRVVIVHGLCWIVVGLLSALMTLGFIDWLVHASGGMRLIFLLLIATGAGWLAYRQLIRPLMEPIRDLDVALRLERLNPFLREQLSSALDFLYLTEDDPLAGSVQLRHRVIQDTLDLSRHLDFDSVVDSQPARTMGAWALCAAGFAALLVLAAPGESSVALLRLANPLGGPAWPRRTRLQIVSAPEKVAKGDSFVVDVAVAGTVPARVDVHFRFADGDQSAPESLRVTKDGLYRGALEQVTRPFQYAIVGGDDSTPWRSVAVVPAPDLTDLRLTLKYPDYTRVPDEEYALGKGHVRAVVGTNVLLSAGANKPLERAELLWNQGWVDSCRSVRRGSQSNCGSICGH